MNRSSWKFTYTADKLLMAAETKINWHEGRLKWWMDQQDEIKEKIKSEGIEIDESRVAAIHFQAVFAGFELHAARFYCGRNDNVVTLSADDRKGGDTQGSNH